ncbi:MAG: hypothetical protein WDM84_04375 [Bauldia sp.]
MREPNVTSTDKFDPKRVIEAMSQIDLAETEAWPDLDLLASRVAVEAIQVDPAGLVISKDGRFDGVFNVYLSLQYGGKNDRFATSDSFLGKYSGHFQSNGNPEIEHVSVDTSRFYV